MVAFLFLTASLVNGTISRMLGGSNNSYPTIHTYHIIHESLRLDHRTSGPEYTSPTIYLQRKINDKWVDRAYMLAVLHRSLASTIADLLRQEERKFNPFSK